MSKMVDVKESEDEEEVAPPAPKKAKVTKGKAKAPRKPRKWFQVSFGNNYGLITKVAAYAAFRMYFCCSFLTYVRHWCFDRFILIHGALF